MTVVLNGFGVVPGFQLSRLQNQEYVLKRIINHLV